jgi:hypothetical protein
MEIGSWRQSTFVAGHRYRVRRDFNALRDSFVADEELTYDRDAYSRYDGYTGYFFTQSETGQLRSWDISDEDDLAVWRELFEEILF